MPPTQNSLTIFRQVYSALTGQYPARHDGCGFVTNLACLGGLRARTATARTMLGLAHLRCTEVLLQSSTTACTAALTPFRRSQPLAQ